MFSFTLGLVFMLLLLSVRFDLFLVSLVRYSTIFRFTMATGSHNYTRQAQSDGQDKCEEKAHAVVLYIPFKINFLVGSGSLPACQLTTLAPSWLQSNRVAKHTKSSFVAKNTRDRDQSVALYPNNAHSFCLVKRRVGMMVSNFPGFDARGPEAKNFTCAHFEGIPSCKSFH